MISDANKRTHHIDEDPSIDQKVSFGSAQAKIAATKASDLAVV